MRLAEIPQISQANQGVDVPLVSLETNLERYKEVGLEMQPDFQREHVWTQKQQEKFVEFLLRGGKTGAILFNQNKKEFVLVDGLQRLTAVLRFLRNEIKAFGHFIAEFEDTIPYNLSLRFEINNLKTRKEILRWYVDLNSGGTVHSEGEIARVQAMIDGLVEVKNEIATE
jgi:uncharacterized protein with ParB-like and HNH nuclease domain